MKKRPIPEYDKTNSIDALFSQSSESASESLSDCIREIFPNVKWRSLKAWMQQAETKSIDPDPILFIALICGAHFRSLSPEVRLQQVLGYLFKWFTEADDLHRMEPDVAKMVVDTIAPGIREKIEEGGHQLGLPKGTLSRKKGRIPDTRGAWVAAAVVEKYLKPTSNKSAAQGQAVHLVSVLLNKEEENALRELKRFYVNAPNNVITDLTRQLTETYELWVKQDGAHAGDLEPSKKDIEKHSAWRLRHKSFQYLIKQNGCERFCNLMLGYISSELLKQLWDIKIR